VSIPARTAARAERLAAELGAELTSPDAPWDLLINATPVGMQPQSDETPLPGALLRRGATVFDTVYRPLETRLLREARERGCRVQDGLDMLVHQAIEQVRLWSGQRPSHERLRAAALAALGQE
jgi:shikimate 5-dehydrogenase